MDTVYSIAYGAQKAWLNGTLHQYDIVERFLRESFQSLEGLEDLLPRLNVLVTTKRRGVTIQRARSVEELVDLIRQTTHIPWVTGAFPDLRNSDDWVLDGGFSRTLHPACERTATVPVTLETTLHTLNPGLSREMAFKFWNNGKRDGSAADAAVGTYRTLSRSTNAESTNGSCADLSYVAANQIIGRLGDPMVGLLEMVSAV
jgi:hypothetical protein